MLNMWLLNHEIELNWKAFEVKSTPKEQGT